MQQYSNTFQNSLGRPVTSDDNAQIEVYTYPGNVLAVLYSDNGVTPKANPVTTDENGLFEFYAADGRYTLVLTSDTTEDVTLTDGVLLEDPADGSEALAEATGAGLVGFSYALTYAAGTIGKWLKDLATSAGAALIGYIDDSPGAAAQTVQSALRNVLHDYTGKADEGIGPPAADPLIPYAAHGVKTYITSDEDSTHAGASLGTLAIVRRAVGSGTFGPASKDFALIISAEKTDHLTSDVDGEIDTLELIGRQGRKGDLGGLIINSSKVRTGAGDDSGGITSMEMRAEITDSLGVVARSLHSIPAFVESVAGLSGGDGYGHWVESRKGTWYSGNHVGAAGAADGAAYEGANGFTYAYSASTSRAAADVFYTVGWTDGAITQGKPGNQRRIRYQSGSGNWQVYDPTTATILLNIDAAGVVSAPGGFQISGGAAKTKEFIARGTIDPPSIAASTTVDLATVTVTGAAIGDVVDAYITTTGSSFSPLRLFGTVTGVDSVTLKGHNTTTSALDVGTLSYVVLARRYA